FVLHPKVVRYQGRVSASAPEVSFKSTVARENSRATPGHDVTAAVVDGSVEESNDRPFGKPSLRDELGEEPLVADRLRRVVSDARHRASPTPRSSDSPPPQPGYDPRPPPRSGGGSRRRSSGSNR